MRSSKPLDALNRKTWFNAEDPDELQTRLNKMTVSFRKSPIDLWNDAARVSADEEQEQMFGRSLGGVYGDLGATASSAAKAGAAAEDESSTAEETAAAEFSAVSMAAYGRRSLGNVLSPEPPKTLVQLEKEHAPEDGTAGFTRLDYVPHGNAPGGRLTLREKVALLDNEERPAAFKEEPRLEQVDVADSPTSKAFTEALQKALSGQNLDESPKEPSDM